MRRTAAAVAEAQSFDRVAVDLDRLSELNRDRDDLITTWLLGLLPAAARYAIDLGCGPGRHAVLLAGRFGQVDAVDLSGPMIELARACRPRPNIFFTREELVRCCDALFPGYRLDVLGGRRGLGLVWDLSY